MNDYIDVINKTIDLCKTLEEGINHIKDLIIFRDYEEIEEVLEDIMDSVEYTEKALKPVFVEIKDKGYKKIIKGFGESLNNLQDKFNDGEMDEAFICIDKKVMPSYNQWKEYLDYRLKRYTYS